MPRSLALPGVRSNFDSLYLSSNRLVMDATAISQRGERDSHFFASTGVTVKSHFVHLYLSYNHLVMETTITSQRGERNSPLPYLA